MINDNEHTAEMKSRSHKYDINWPIDLGLDIDTNILNIKFVSV